MTIAVPAKMFPNVLLVLLLTTACGRAASASPQKTPLHVCHFDKIMELPKTLTPTNTEQPQRSYTLSQTRTIVFFRKPTPTTTLTPTRSHTQTSSNSQSSTATFSASVTASETESPTDTATQTDTLSESQSETRTISESLSKTASESQSETQTHSESLSKTESESQSETQTASESQSETETHSESMSETESESETQSDSESVTASASSSDSETITGDTVKKQGKSLTTLQALSSDLITWAAYLAETEFRAEGGDKNWSTLRIGFSSPDLRDSAKYCDKNGLTRTDAFGANVTCQAEDVLTGEKKRNLYRIVRSAISMHTSRLKVQPSPNHLVVPSLEGAFCGLFTVPKAHTTSGVKGTDMLLYVSSFPSSLESMFAAGAPCAMNEKGRPTVGAFTFVTRHIAPTVYSVRVAAHEISHALGFAYSLMKRAFNMTIAERSDVRKKPQVTEVQSSTVVAKVKEHYKCNESENRGMELEDEVGVLDVVSRSHWERRNALEELMAGIVTAGLYTTLTLAMFEDTKVYKADFTKAETMRWGRDAGCDFFTKRCVGDGADFPSMFCRESNEKKLYCAPGRRALGRCSMIKAESGLPEQYKYIGENQTGEKALLTDRCPIVEEYRDTSCTQESGGLSGIGLVSPQSWCLQKEADAIEVTLTAEIDVAVEKDVQTADTGATKTAQTKTANVAVMASADGVSAAAGAMSSTDVTMYGICGMVSATGDSDVSVSFEKNGTGTQCTRVDSELVVTMPGSPPAAKYECPSFDEVQSANRFDAAYQSESNASEPEERQPEPPKAPPKPPPKPPVPTKQPTGGGTGAKPEKQPAQAAPTHKKRNAAATLSPSAPLLALAATVVLLCAF